MIRRWTSWMEKFIWNFQPLIKIYERYYKKTLKEEIELASIEVEDKVLVVGGGAVPCTAFLLARETGAKIDVIDMDKEAVEKARSLIKRNKLEDRVNIYLANAKDISIDSYDVVHLAMQIYPKEEILNKMWLESKRGTRLIIRQPKKILKPFYSNISKKSLEDKKVIGLNLPVKNNWTAIDNLLLMEK